MAGFIANDWKAIHDRMEQIQTERTGVTLVCHRCGNKGWVSDTSNVRGAAYSICKVCRNPKGLPNPAERERGGVPRA